MYCLRLYSQRNLWHDICTKIVVPSYYLRCGLEPVSFDPIPPMQILYCVILLGRYFSEHACRCWKVLAYAALVYDRIPIRIPVIVPTVSSTINIFFVHYVMLMDSYNKIFL